MTRPPDRQDPNNPEVLAVESLPAELLVVSDVHLRNLEDRRGRLLLDLLKRLNPAPEWVVLNGDIFDFCYGGNNFFRRKFAELGEALTTLTRRGSRVALIEGNHEYHMQWMGWENVAIVQSDRLKVAMSDGTRILIGHGDQLADDPLYKIFRSVMKSRFVDFFAQFVPGAMLDAYALRHAALSRSRDPYRKIHHQKILSDFDRWLASETEFPCQHGIVGHFHVPYAESRPSSDGLMLSVESWDRPNALIYSDSKFKRVYMVEPGGPFEVVGIESLF